MIRDAGHESHNLYFGDNKTLTITNVCAKCFV